MQRQNSATQVQEPENKMVVYNDDHTTEGLLRKLKRNQEEIHEACQDLKKELVDLCKTIKNHYLQPLRDEYLQNHDNSYLEKTDEIESCFIKLVNELQYIPDERERAISIKNFRDQWGGVLLVNQHIKSFIHQTSKHKSDLTKNDIEQVLVLTCEDLFENFKFIESRRLTREMIIVPEEDPSGKCLRIMEAHIEQYKQHKKSLSYQAISFFNRHPVACYAALVAGSIAVGVATGCAAEYITETMGYRK